MNKNLPIYKIKVDPNDESGVYAISLVDSPAIESDFIHLSEIIELVELEFSVNKDKQILYGPLLIPNKLIFRKDSKDNEYYIVFDEQTIEIIADKYNENQLNKIFNFQHSNVPVEAVLLENWLTGDNDKAKTEFGFDVPKGTWFSKVKVKDEKFWLTKVKNGKVKGFSVEVKAGLELALNNNNNEEIKNVMELKTKDGASLYLDGELMIDGIVYSDEAMTLVAEDKTYELEDGSSITITNGAVSSIDEAKVSDDATVLEDDKVDATEPTKLALDPEEVMAIIAPELEAIRASLSEVMAKIAEFEAKVSQDGNVNSELSAKVELLSKAAGAISLTVKTDDRQQKRNETIISKINSLNKK